MLKIYHLENSRSQRIIWLAQELGLEYEVVRFNRDKKTNLAPKEFMDIHPLGKAPVIDDGGVIVAESGAIIEYLVNKYDVEYKLHPQQEEANFKDYIYWLHFAEGSLMSPLVMRYIHLNAYKKTPLIFKPVAKLIFSAIDAGYLNKHISTLFSYIESHLDSHRYFLGESLSAVDIMMSFPLEAAISGRINRSDYPRIVEYINTIQSNENYQEAIRVGGPYAY